MDTGSSPPRFKPGDRVQVRQNAGHSVWTVVALDTNRTPTRDPQHAYKLSNGGKWPRYAYESDLVLVE